MDAILGTRLFLEKIKNLNLRLKKKKQEKNGHTIEPRDGVLCDYYTG